MRPLSRPCLPSTRRRAVPTRSYRFTLYSNLENPQILKSTFSHFIQYLLISSHVNDRRAARMICKEIPKPVLLTAEQLLPLQKRDTGLIARRCRKFLIVFFDLTAKNKHGQIGPPLHQTEYNLFKLSKLWMPMIWTNEYEHKGQRSLLYWCKSWILEKIQKIVQRAQGMASPIINHCEIRHILKNFKYMPDLQNMTGTGAVEPVIGESGKPTPVVGGRREAQGLTPPTASSPPVIALTWTQSILIRKFNHKKISSKLLPKSFFLGSLVFKSSVSQYLWHQLTGPSQGIDTFCQVDSSLRYSWRS